MGASLFGHKQGETVTVHLPNGNSYELVIKKVELA
jgi:transcription elongation GreA/GreB family factor